MPNNPPVLARGTSAYIIASICVLTALLQLGAGITLLNQPAGSEFLSTADSAMRARILLPLGLAVFMHLAAGIAVYLMRIEALACMGCLLARQLAAVIDRPIQVITVLDLALLLILTYFTTRLFAQSSARHLTTRSGWRLRFTMLLVGLAAGHLTILMNNVSAYPTLVSTGSVSPLMAAAALFGCAALYAAVLIMPSRPERAKKFFLFAAFAMGLTLPAWGYRYGFSTPCWIGVPVALFGFGLARFRTVSNQALDYVQ